MKTKIVLLLAIFTILLTNNLFAYSISDIEDIITSNNKRSAAKAVTIVTESPRPATEDKESDIDSVSMETIDIWISNKIEENRWISANGKIYFAQFVSDKTEQKPYRYAVTLLKNGQYLIGDSSNQYYIYSFDSNGVSTADNNAVLYDSSGNAVNNSKSSGIPVYNNPSGWFQKDSKWYYYTDGSNVLINGYAILPVSLTNNNYRLYKFDKKGINTSGSGKEGSISYVQSQITDSKQGATKTKCTTIGLSTNTSFNSSAALDIKQTNGGNSQGATKAGTGNLSNLLDNTYDNGSNYTTDDGGWKKYSSYYRYYIDGSNFLANGSAIIADNDNATSYSLYTFANDGLAKPENYRGFAIEKFEEIGNGAKTYSIATTKVDSNAAKAIENNETAENLEVIYNYSQWKKIDSQWRIYDDNDNYLLNGYAIVVNNAAGTQFVLGKFDKNGFYSQVTTIGIKNSPEAVIEACGSASYEPADWINSTDPIGGSQGSDTIDQLTVYDDYSGWEKTNGRDWYEENGEYLANGWAIVVWDTSGNYAVCKFDNQGYLTSYEAVRGPLATLYSTYAGNAYLPAHLTQGSEPTEGDDSIDYQYEMDDSITGPGANINTSAQITIEGKTYDYNELINSVKAISVTKGPH